MSDREKFEKRFRGEMDLERSTNTDGYKATSTEWAWVGFQSALSSRDSTPTEGVGKRVVEEWMTTMSSVPDTASNWGVMADLAQRIDRALAAPRMTLDLRFAFSVERMYFPDAVLKAIREQLPNVEVVTEN